MRSTGRYRISFAERCGTVSLTVTGSNINAIRLYDLIGFNAKWVFPALVWEGF